MHHHVRAIAGAHAPRCGAHLLLGGAGWRCGRLLVATLRLSRGGQGLEEAGDVAKALVCVSEVAVAPHGSLQGLDGIQLEVLSIHWNVRSQGLKVKVIPVRLGKQGDGLWKSESHVWRQREGTNLSVRTVVPLCVQSKELLG